MEEFTAQQRWYKKGIKLLAEIEGTVVPAHAIAVWFLGQSGFALKGDDLIIYVDPFLSPYLDEKGMPKRDYPPPFEPEAICHVDWVFCTHQHVDHFDPETIGPIARACPKAHFVIPAPFVGLMGEMGIEASRIIPARAGVPMELEKMRVVPIAAAHEEYQLDLNGDHHYLGFVICLNGVTFYHAGDTIETSDLVDTLKSLEIDIAFLPINGTDWKRRRLGKKGNMNAREAANVASQAGVKLVVPMHWDLLSRNGENPAIFVDYMVRLYPNCPFKVMVPGERIIYMK